VRFSKIFNNERSFVKNVGVRTLFQTATDGSITGSGVVLHNLPCQHLSMFLAEIDPVQIVIIVIAMAAGFVQWLWGLFQQNKAERQRGMQPAEADEEIEKLREEAWRKQVAGESAPSKPSPQAPRPVSDDNPWTVIREIMEKAQEATKQATPPPLPPPVQTRPPALERQPAAPRSAKEAPPPPRTPALPAAPIPPSRAFPVTSRARSQGSAALFAKQLSRPESIRQAILMREILGPPKALQSPADAPL